MTAEEERTWSRWSADRAAYLSQQNEYVESGSCFLARAFAAAADAHITVVNHAWLITNLRIAGEAERVGRRADRSVDGPIWTGWSPMKRTCLKKSDRHAGSHRRSGRAVQTARPHQQ